MEMQMKLQTTISIKQLCQMKRISRATVYNNRNAFTWTIDNRIIVDQKFKDFKRSPRGLKSNLTK